MIEWLLGADASAWRDPGTAVSMTHAFPGWAWALAVAAVIGAVAWSYRGIGGSVRTRAVLGGCRVLTLALLLVLAAGPRIERGRTLVEEDRVMILLDDSGSMRTSEPAPTGDAAPRSDQLQTILETHADAFARLDDARRVTWMSFAHDASALDPAGAVPVPRPTRGQTTRLGGAVSAALAQAGTKPVAAIVVLSDGRSFDEIDAETRERLDAERIPVFTLPIGSEDPVREARIRSVEHPDAAFEDDTIPIVVRIAARGHAPGEEIAVELVDDATGRTRSRETVRVGEDGRVPDATLTRRAPDPGEHPMRVRVSSGAAAPAARGGERAISVRVVETPMRVLYLDGLPRWEYRYLKNTLVREPSIEATCMLLARDRRFITEGVPLGGPIPETPEAWAPFDAVVIGDLSPDLLSRAQQRSLLEHVETAGCGVLWIAGPGATPARWGDAPLAALLPIERNTRSPGSGVPPRERVMVPTPESERLGLLRGPDGEPATRVSDPNAGWSVLRWSAPVGDDALKPGVRVIARGPALDGDRAAPALVTMMRYGAGRAAYVGTDEIWRWRYGRGEDLPERFWLPILRTLGRGTIARRGVPGRLVVEPERPAPDDPVRVTLELFDRAAIEAVPESIDARISPDSTRDPEQTITLEGAQGERSSPWTPARRGVYTIGVAHPALGAEPVTARVRVERSDAETRNPSTDHAALRTLAESTNGAVLSPPDLADLGSRIPNRTRVTALPPEITPLWDAPIALIALITLLSIEWIGRRVLRLA